MPMKLVATIIILGLSLGPLGAYEDEAGNLSRPYLDNIILMISIFFAVTGTAFGYAAGTFRSLGDVVKAMVKQMNTMGYILVLTFFCYNFLFRRLLDEGGLVLSTSFDGFFFVVFDGGLTCSGFFGGGLLVFVLLLQFGLDLADANRLRKLVVFNFKF